MSANNQLEINKVGEEWHIHNVDVDTGSGFPVGDAPTLQEAIKLANDYRADNEVEYGLAIIPY